MSNLHFSVYKHQLVLNDSRLITRQFIVVKDEDNDIVKWTNYHLLINNSSRKIHNIAEDGNKYFLYVCMFLNYVFFDHFQINSLYELTVEMIQSFLNDYGMGRLKDNDAQRNKNTVDICMMVILNFVRCLIEKSKGRVDIKISELYKEKSCFNKKKRKYENRLVPAFEVFYIDNTKIIFRDIPDKVFAILLNLIIQSHKDILMLVAFGAFAGMRPSECCNVRRQDSLLGPGFTMTFVDNELCDVTIDLRAEINLRSDLKPVGKIKRERIQKVYKQFLAPFYNCYCIYMEYLNGLKYEKNYGPLTINNNGKAMTYETYSKKFKKIVKNELIPLLFNSNDAICINYAYMLQEHSIGPHIVRHWFSVQLTLFGEDIAGLMYWRGDKSPDSAFSYLQNKGDLERRFREVNNELFSYSLWKAGKLHED